MRGALWIVLAALVAGVFGVACVQVGRTASGGTNPAVDRLPDLDQEAPFGLNVTAAGSGRDRTYWLGFGSAVRNVGAGPLILDGHRPDATTPAMTADQTIEHGDSTAGVIPNVGRMMFVTSPDHRHWHYLHFDRYQLRRAGRARSLLRDQKTGFCLGDRYAVPSGTVADAASAKVYTSRCGLDDTQLLQLREGISVGYGDLYKPFLEGQDLPLKGLARGRYVLVHRVNADRRLRELSYRNNAAAVLFDLRWTSGVPNLRVLRICPDSGQCERPLPATEPIRIPTFGGTGRAAAAATAHASSSAAGHRAEPFLPDDEGLGTQPGGWAETQWNFVGPYGVDAPSAWANLISAGRPGASGVLVAVLDTGIAYADQPPYRRSPDLGATRFVKGWDFVDNDPFPVDENGHGTHVASTIAEQTNNGYALTGLAYGARIMPVRVLDALGDGYPEQIARGIRFAADHGAKIINMSFNFDPATDAAQIPEVIRAIAYAHKHGSIVVAAAGNNASSQVAYPAHAPHAISVGATTENGCLAVYSNVGRGLDLVAPGGGSDADLSGDANCVAGRPGRPIYQMTFRGGSVADFEAENYVGTSMATAHVSAIAALVVASGVLGAQPKPDAVQRRLERSARELGAPGYDTRYGWGLVDAATATTRGKPQRPLPVAP